MKRKFYDIALGGGKKKIEKQHAKEKLTARERIEYLKDTDSNFLEIGVFTEGLGFDGSSVRGFQSIEQSDMIVVPDVATAYIDPFFSEKTIAFYCDIKDPITKENYSRDPRNIAKKA